MAARPALVQKDKCCLWSPESQTPFFWLSLNGLEQTPPPRASDNSYIPQPQEPQNPGNKRMRRWLEGARAGARVGVAFPDIPRVLRTAQAPRLPPGSSIAAFALVAGAPLFSRTWRKLTQRGMLQARLLATLQGPGVPGSYPSSSMAPDSGTFYSETLA